MEKESFKKFLIIISSVIIIVFVVCVSIFAGFYFNKHNNTTETAQNVKSNEQESLANEDLVEEIKKGDTEEKQEVAQEKIEDAQEKFEEQTANIITTNHQAKSINNQNTNITNNKNTNDKAVNNVKQETKVENKTTTQNETTNNTAVNNQAQNNTNQSSQNNTKENNNQNEETQIQQVETQPQQQVVQQPERKIEYKQNNEYIQKMKTYISSHESESMKKYGYSFVVDADIVNYTNYFTYSDFNMSGCTGSAGEYRLYARDYYYNGKFVETQCFLY